MSAPLLRRLSPCEVPAAAERCAGQECRAAVAAILADVRVRGEAALREQAHRLGDLKRRGDAIVVERAALAAAARSLPREQLALLERVAARITSFARAQRKALAEMTVAVPGGRAGHRVHPLRRAGCYAPGGRHPLPSSVLMTACVARAAGVEEVWVASPRPAAVTLAAAAVAGADALLAVGGAQAIAALAYGAGPVPAVDVIAGPGNRWVTAAKELVAGEVRIDFPAGPSELLVVADASADPILVAADLLAQAEHDSEALPVLVALDDSLLEAVEGELERQLASLPGAAVVRAALARGFAVRCRDRAEAIDLCERLAAEHVELMVAQPAELGERLSSYGALFIGAASAEVLGDYGAGPNHVLPTGGQARRHGGLSVLHFLALRTWLELEPGGDQGGLLRDAAALARLEGLEGHARSADLRARREVAAPAGR